MANPTDINLGGQLSATAVAASAELTVAGAILAREAAAQGMRGLVHLSALDWAPTTNADSHAFEFASANYSYIEFRVSGLSNAGLSYKLRPDGGDIGCYSALYYHGTNPAYAYNNRGAVADCFWAAGSGFSGVVRLTRLPDGAFSMDATGGISDSTMRLAKGRVGAWGTSITLVSSGSVGFPANVSRVEVWAIPVALNSTVAEELGLDVDALRAIQTLGDSVQAGKWLQGDPTSPTGLTEAGWAEHNAWYYAAGVSVDCSKGINQEIQLAAGANTLPLSNNAEDGTRYRIRLRQPKIGVTLATLSAITATAPETVRIASPGTLGLSGAIGGYNDLECECQKSGVYGAAPVWTIYVGPDVDPT